MNRTDFIRKNMKGRVLDVGCEQGTLHNLIKNEDIYGLDISPKKFRNRVVKADAQSIPFKENSFDTLIAGELIEHLSNPEDFLKESKRVLKPNGKIIISTPNKKSWVNRIFKSYFHRWHVSLFDVNSLKEFASKYFAIEKFFCLPYDEVSSWGSRHKEFYRLRKFIHHLLPKSLQENIIILGRNKK